VQQCVFSLITSSILELMQLQKITPSEAVSWALFDKINLKDIVLASISLDAGVWIPEFYVLRM
jgi:hypothetical protein